MKPRSIPLGQLYLIEWKDATSARSGWYVMEEVNNFPCIGPLTVGFVVRCDTEGITLAQTLAAREAEKVAGLWRIPWGCVRKLYRVGVK